MSRQFPQPAPSRQFPMPSPFRTTPSAFHVPTKTGRKAALLTLSLDSGNRQFSFDGISTIGGFYDPRIIHISEITRELSYVGGSFRRGDVTVTLANPNREWQTILANESIIGRRAEIALASTADPIEEAEVPFSGTIESIEIRGEAEVDIAIHDTSWDFFDRPLSATLKSIDLNTFPNLPSSAQGYIGKLVPVVYGAWTGAASADGNYALPAYLVDPAIGGATYVYVICQLATTDIGFNGVTPLTSAYVRRYGGAWVGATPTLTQQIFDGVTMLCIEFASDQRDTGRPNELEITWVMDGISDPQSALVPITNPVSQLYSFLSRYAPAGISSTDFDKGSGTTATNRSCGNSSWLEAETISDDFSEHTSGLAWESLVWIGGDPNQTFSDVIARFSESFPMGVYVNRAGRFAAYMFQYSAAPVRDFSLGQFDGFASGYITLSEDAEIVAGSYRSGPADDVATEVMQIQGRHVVDSKPFDALLYQNSTFLKYLAGKPRQFRREAEYLSVSNGDTAKAVSSLLSPLNRIHEFRVPIEWFWELELTRTINILHRHATGSYRNEVILDSPDAYWRLGETVSAYALDNGVVGNQIGTYVGSPTLGFPGALVGDSNGAVALDGSSQYVTVPDSTQLDPGDTFTLEAWIYLRDNAASDQTIFSKGTDGYWLHVAGAADTFAGTLSLRKQGGNLLRHSGATIPFNTWTHVVATKDGSTRKLYINGLEDGAGGLNATVTGTATDLNIGRRTDNTRYFNGAIDEAAIYPTALSADRIMRHYLTGKARYSPTTVAYVVGLEVNPNPSDLDILVRALEVRVRLTTLN